MNKKRLGWELLLISITLALLWIGLTHGRDELIRIITETAKVLGIIALFLIALTGFMLILGE